MGELTPLGWKVPEEVFKMFKDFCDDTGSGYQDAIAAAMVIWPHLPASVQRAAQLEAKGKPSVGKKFWEEFRKGLDDAV